MKGTEILDLLTTLVGKSLIIADRNQGQETRFRLLETVRQYAGEKLARDKLSNEEESHWLRTRHRDYYLQLVETAAEKFTSGGRREWTHRLSLEHDNLRLALEWSFHDCVEVEAGLRISVAFVLFMGIQGYEREGIDWLLVGLERCRSRPISALLRAQALNALGNCLWFMGDFTAARRWLEMSIAACRELGAAAAAELSTSLAALGMSSVYDDPTFARDLLEESVAVARGLDSARGQYLRTALFFKAWISIFSLNERESALQDAQEAYALALQVGVREERAAPLLIMGRVAFERNDFELARRHYEEALAIFEEATDRYGAMEAYLIIGQFYSDQGNYDQSLLHYREFFRIWNFFGSRQPITLSYVALLGSLEVRQFQRSPVERRYVHLQRAAIFFGAVEKLRGELNIFDRTYSLADYTREVETLRSHLEEADLVQAWSAGQAMILEQALAYLLETYG